jgi:hypothetical protein
VPTHEFWLRITIDPKPTVVDAEAPSGRGAYPDRREVPNPAHFTLFRLNLIRHFHRPVRRLFAARVGSMHFTELCTVRLPRFKRWPATSALAHDGATAVASDANS